MEEEVLHQGLMEVLPCQQSPEGHQHQHVLQLLIPAALHVAARHCQWRLVHPSPPPGQQHQLMNLADSMMQQYLKKNASKTE